MRVNACTNTNEELLPAAMHLGDQICDMRLRAGLTQQELANALGYCMASISRWESGLRCPPVTALVKMADLFRENFVIMPSPREYQIERRKPRLPQIPIGEVDEWAEMDGL